MLRRRTSLRNSLVFPAVALLISLILPTSRVGAQPAAGVHRIAMIVSQAPAASIAEGGLPTWSALLKALRQRGYIEGSNLIVDRWTTKGHADLKAAVAVPVVSRQPRLIVAAASVPLLKALTGETKTIPIVTVAVAPVTAGFAASYAHPGGNVTGLSADAGMAMDRKRLEILHEVVPSARRVGYLYTHGDYDWNGPLAVAARDAARQLGVTLVPAESAHPLVEGEYAGIFAAMAKAGVDAVLAPPAAEYLVAKDWIVKQAALTKLPAIYCQPYVARPGGLMSYGPYLPDLYRRAASYVDRTLHGANPAELPIEQASEFRLILNRTAARGLGLTFPRAVLIRADEVID